MDSEIIGAIITAVTSLISALIGAWVAITVEGVKTGGTSKKTINNRTESGKKIIAFWAIVGAVLGAVITLFLLGRTPSFSVDQYDEFNNPFYQDQINTDLWKRLQDPNCDVKQEENAAVFRLNQLSTVDTLCLLRMPNRVSMNEVGGVDARLLAKNNADGDFSIVTLEFQTIGFTENTIWVADCGIRQDPLENKVELYLYVNGSHPDGEAETFQTIEAASDQWYNMRLEMDPDTGTLRCYANDKVIASHRPQNVEFLITQMFNRHITAFWSPNSTSTFMADDVVLQP